MHFFKLVIFIFFTSYLMGTPIGDNILISEVQYDPATPAGHASSEVENEAEWFELFNPTSSTIDISGWTIKEGAAPIYTFPAVTTITSGSYLLVTNRTDRFQLNFPAVVPDLEMNPGGAGLLKLNNTGDQLTLRNTASDIVDFVEWDSAAWPVVGGPGQTICRTVSLDTDVVADWATNCVSSPGTGTLSANNAPVANNDSTSTPINTPITLTLITSNDTDIDGTVNPSTIILIDPSNPVNIGQTGLPLVIAGKGTYTVDVAGNVIFSPDLGFVGVANINYTVNDNNGGVSNQAMLIISVASIPPVANDDAVSTPMDVAVTLSDITSNDTDSDGTVDPSTIILIDPSNSANIGQTGIPLVIAGKGTYTVDAVGNVTFSPDVGFVGAANINYTVNDNNGVTSNIATISIGVDTAPIKPFVPPVKPVVPTPTSPVILATDNTVTISQYGNGVSFEVLSNGDVYEALINIEFSQPDYGVLTLDDGATPNDFTDDRFSYVLYDENYDTGTYLDYFTYTIIDADGNRATAIVTLDIQCSSSQRSDNGDALNIWSMICLVFMTLLSGLYLRKEEETI